MRLPKRDPNLFRLMNPDARLIVQPLNPIASGVVERNEDRYITIRLNNVHPNVTDHFDRNKRVIVVAESLRREEIAQRELMVKKLRELGVNDW
jgi:hypothetical protein